MAKATIQEHLGNLTREELARVSMAVLNSRGGSAPNKQALIDRLMQEPNKVAAHLGIQRPWWRQSKHTYGLLGILVGAVSLVLTYASLNAASTQDDPARQNPKTTAEDAASQLRAEGDAAREKGKECEPFGLKEQQATLHECKIEGATEATRLPLATADGIKVLDTHVVFDLREWEQLESYDIAHDDKRARTSHVVSHTSVRMQRNDKTDNYLVLSHTSGRDLFVRPDKHPLTVHFCDDIGDFGTSKTNLKVLDFDISEEPTNSEFTLKFSKTYVNAFQANDQWWAGYTSGLPSEELTLLILLPKNKPFATAVGQVETADGHAASMPRRAHLVTDSKDRLWIWWHIEHPLPDLRYRIRWTY